MKLIGTVIAILLVATAGAAQAQSVQVGPRGVEVTPGYGQTGPGPCGGLQHRARVVQERLAGAVNPAERARLQERLVQIREQQARCGR
jgi:hypothetical protein